MTLRIHNTLSRAVETFTPIDPQHVRMYVCGMTIYDLCHVGHARFLLVFDMVYRWLRTLGYQVTYVRNITDIDDKIIKRAVERGIPIRQLTAEMTAAMHEDIARIGVLPPTHEPRATEYVPQMLDMIATLERKGLAYRASNGDVNYSVRKFPGYGKLSGKSLDQLRAGERVAVLDGKEDPLDFVLWKSAKESEPDDAKWASPFGAGRPGWHIECSAMGCSLLGQHFDIHGGGLDLIFPHHENEIAQSRCAHGTAVMANVWMHNGFLQVEGQKMSKSLGNFHTIAELLETKTFGGRKWPGEVLRLAMLMTHYREPIDFSVRKLEEAEALIGKWRRKVAGQPAGAVSEPFLSALGDDLDFAQYLRLMNEAALPASELKAAAELVGVDVSELTTEVDVADIVAQRLAFIRDKNWKEADRIRDELLAQGVQLKDGKDPATGERVTTWEVKR